MTVRRSGIAPATSRAAAPARRERARLSTPAAAASASTDGAPHHQVALPAPEQIEALVDDALCEASMRGILVRERGRLRYSVHAPLSLLPTPLPRAPFEQVRALAPLVNTLVHRVSLDDAFLRAALAETIQSDEFTARLFRIYETVELPRRSGGGGGGDSGRGARLGLHRADYMLHTAEGAARTMLQVEMNTISSSFAALSGKVSGLHKYLVGRHTSAHNGVQGGAHLVPDAYNAAAASLPDNRSSSFAATGLAAAFELYNDPRAAVLMVVQDGEANRYDQEWVTLELWEKFGISTLRASLAYVQEKGELTAAGGLRLDGHAVAVVYFRAGYTPDDYPSEVEWQGREKIEASDAIKCPAIDYHLVGAKKIQQELAAPGALERFMDPGDCAALRACFAGLWTLEEGDVVQQAIEAPQNFVLKPQREGGGNNLYGEELRDALQRLQSGSVQDRAAYILMQRIFPPSNPAVLVRNGEWSVEETLSELGVYSIFLSDGTSAANDDSNSGVLVNEAHGHLLRTKSATSDEGGVAAGFAVLDSPLLY
mmetsp:Transcript_5927/g.21662  ORF Transcript_5927/g.21662 Transcript_5927/m.21662 type:complete len:541 (+) Transcript_5927:1-1623(+)